MKLVKVARVGSKVVEVAVPSEATVGQCLSVAGVTMGPNDDVYHNHSLVSVGSRALNDAVIIVEPKKRIETSSQMIKFIQCLIEEEFIEGYDYEDEDFKVDFDSLYYDEKSMIDLLIKLAKEV